MKKLKSFVLLLAVMLLLPISVFAENEKINVYIFRGEGCGFCAKALAFFDSLDEEYKSYFNLVEREVWNDSGNASKMQEVASYFNEELKGVPYIIIGEKTFQGYAEDYDEDIKAAIKAGYENKDGSYKDVVGPILNNESVEKKEDENTAAMTIIVVLAVVAGLGFLIYMARDDSVVEEEKEKKETTKVPSKKETDEKITTKTPKKKETTKKTTSKKTTTTKKKSTNKK